MGTCCTTRIRFKRGKNSPVTLLTFHRHSDGHPDSHGLELANELGSYEIVNGLRIGGGNANQANGPGCLAAQLLCSFKDGPGGIYLVPDNEDEFTGNYHYDVTITETYSSKFSKPTYKIGVIVWSGEPDKLMFNGSLAKFTKWCEDN